MMTAGDWLATAVLVVFIAAALAGWLKWVFRILTGAALGAVLLVGLAHAGDVPGLSGVSDLLGRGRITPAVTDGAGQAAVALGVDWPARKTASPEVQPEWPLQTLEAPGSTREAPEVHPVPDPRERRDRWGR
jgi:hypothetical protein